MEYSNNKVSVIVPVYNAERYVKQCIDSVLSQSYHNYELLLIDDGSTDSSTSIINHYRDCYPNRIKAIHQKNSGVSSARNAGVDNSEGKWIAFIDSDDYIDSELLERSVSVANKDNSDLVFSDFNNVDKQNTSLFKTFAWSGNKDKAFVEYLSRNWPRWSLVLIRKSLFTQYRIRFPENLTIFEDLCVLVRLVFFAERVSYINKPLYNYRVDNNCSITHILEEERLQSQFFWAYNDMIIFFRNQGAEMFIKPLCWRILCSQQKLVLNKEFLKFKNIMPEKQDYILSCPNLNHKMKLMMWCITHSLFFVAGLMIDMRRLFRVAGKH